MDKALKARAKAAIRAYPDLLAEQSAPREQHITTRYDSIGRGGGTVARTAEDTALWELPAEKKRQYMAVRVALSLSEALTAVGGNDMEQLIYAMYWRDPPLPQADAALEVGLSMDSVKKMHPLFLQIVGFFLQNSALFEGKSMI